MLGQIFPGADTVSGNVRACIVVTDSLALAGADSGKLFSNSFKLQFRLSDVLRCSFTLSGRSALCALFIWAWWDFAWKWNHLQGVVIMQDYTEPQISL